MEEAEDNDSNFRGAGHGFYAWRDITPPSITPENEDTHSWWVVRRAVGWISKLGDDCLPPII